MCRVVAVLTLALGIGANTVIFSVVNGVLLRPLPYEDAGGLVTLWQNSIKTGATYRRRRFSRQFPRLARPESGIRESAAEPYTHNMVENGEPEAFRSWLVTEGFFEVLGVQPALGRTFTAEEYIAGNQFVVVIGYGLWQSRFCGDLGLIGRQLRLNGQPHTVVVVMPPEFQFPSGRQMWAPRLVRDIDRQKTQSGPLRKDFLLRASRPWSSLSHGRLLHAVSISCCSAYSP